MTKRQKPKVKGNTETKLDGKASSTKRNEIQQTQHANNLTGKETYGKGFHTRWETSKRLRRINRIAKGKTRANWERTNSARAPKANVSNTSITRNGGEKQSNQRSDRLAPAINSFGQQ